SHRHWPTPADLLTEPRNHRARRTKHVTETNHGKAGTVHLTHSGILTPAARRLLMAESLQHQLRQALGAAHPTGRPHSLVGADQYTILHPALDGRLSRIQGAEHIVHDAFGNVVLHHGHMLVGGG